jgi:hypothetical protein
MGNVESKRYFRRSLREMSDKFVSVCFVVISIGRVGPKINHG